MVSDRRITERSSWYKMASWVFILSKFMGDTSKYLVYAVNVRRWNDKSGRSYVSFGDVYFEIEFTEACFRKLVISLSRIEVEDVYKTFLLWCG